MAVSSGKERFIKPYAQKWGDEAAEYRWRMRIATALLGFPGLASIFLSLAIPGKSGIRLTLLGIGFLLGMALVVYVFVGGRRMNAAATRTLGIPIGWKVANSPPVKALAYEDWCRKNGLVPYGASKRFSLR